MKSSKEEWLDNKITEDMLAEASERARLLAEMEELQDIDMPMEKLEDIHRELEKRNSTKRKPRRHLRVALAAAAILILLVGASVVSSGSKLYMPTIFQKERGDEISSKINNSEDAVVSQEDEEEVCQEIEDQLGVLPVRLGYRPEGIELATYSIDTDLNDAMLEYQIGEKLLHVYISKDYNDSSFNWQTDGAVLEMVSIEACNMEVPLSIIDDTQGGEYYSVEFEYLNTYYMVVGMMEKEEFIKILENIAIKNA